MGFLVHQPFLLQEFFMTHAIQIKAIIGLGNPGKNYEFTRHNIGFRVIDELVTRHQGTWRTKGKMDIAEVAIENQSVLLIKPQTFMNNSGVIIPVLMQQGIKPEEILVVHDELELPFGTLKIKKGGSAKGHNGLKSIIAACGPEFYRLRCGISRPVNREEVPDYVLKPFAETHDAIDSMIQQASDMSERMVSEKKL